MKLRPLIFLLFAGCSGHGDAGTAGTTEAETAIPVLNFSVASVYRHDTTSYTEGLLFHDHQLFESSGATPEDAQTRSMAGIVNMTTGKIDKKVELDRNRYFGEGIYQLNFSH
jgi:glutamine cyclotransferase